jgi:hypothetical protein
VTILGIVRMRYGVTSLLTIVTFVVVVCVSSIEAQEFPRIAFEVASVKTPVSQERRGATFRMLPSGHFEAENISLLMLIGRAYQVPRF